MNFKTISFALVALVYAVTSADPVPPNNFVAPPENFPINKENVSAIVGAGHFNSTATGYDITCLYWNPGDDGCGLLNGRPECNIGTGCCIMVPSKENGGDHANPWIGCYGPNTTGVAESRWSRNSTMYRQTPVPLYAEIGDKLAFTNGTCKCGHGFPNGDCRYVECKVT